MAKAEAKAKETTESKTKAKKPSHPSFLKMAQMALKNSYVAGSRSNYLSRQAIGKWIQEKYGEKLNDNWSVYLSRALKKGVEDKNLRKHKASYMLSTKDVAKLNAAAPSAEKKKRKTTKKKTPAKKTTVKAKAKASTKEKRRAKTSTKSKKKSSK